MRPAKSRFSRLRLGLAVLALLAWQGATAESVTRADIRVEDLAALLGTFQTVELSIPEGTLSIYDMTSWRGEVLTQGASSVAEEDLLDPLRVTIGRVRVATHCEDAFPLARTLVIGGSSRSSISCIELEPDTGGGSRLFTDQDEIALNEWMPLWAFVPHVSDEQGEAWREDPDPDNWIIYQIWFSDQEVEVRPDLPAPPSYRLDEQRRLEPDTE